MNYDMSSYFEDPEFKELLAKYEGMAESHAPTYFDAEELTDIAEYYASRGEDDKAEEAIDFALRLHPGSTDALVFKSRSLAIKGNMDEAYRVAGLIEDTSDREVKFLKADLLIEERRLEEAEAIYQELAEEENNSEEVLLDIAMTYMDVNQKEYAAKWLKKIKEKGINETNSQKFRDVWCDFCMTFGEPEKATKAFQLSLDEYPYSLSHWNGLAKCYLAQDEIEKALEAVDFALAIDEENGESLEVKAYCFIQSGNLEEATRICHKLIVSVDGDRSRIYSLLMRCYMELEMAEEAMNICHEWLKECPKLTGYEKSEIYNCIALCLSNLNRPEEGMKYVDAALSLNPFYRGAILQKATLHLQMFEYSAAYDLFQKALSLTPEDEQATVLYDIVNYCYCIGKYVEVLGWCGKIIEQYPDDKEEALYYAAASYYYMGATEKCMNCLTQAWEAGGNRFNEQFTEDNRFKAMFIGIKEIINKKKSE